MKSAETKQSTIKDKIKTETPVADDTGFDFKIEKITIGYKTQQQSTKKPII